MVFGARIENQQSPDFSLSAITPSQIFLSPQIVPAARVSGSPSSAALRGYLRQFKANPKPSEQTSLEALFCRVVASHNHELCKILLFEIQEDLFIQLLATCGQQLFESAGTFEQSVWSCFFEGAAFANRRQTILALLTLFSHHVRTIVPDHPWDPDMREGAYFAYVVLSSRDAVAACDFVLELPDPLYNFLMLRLEREGTFLSADSTGWPMALRFFERNFKRTFLWFLLQPDPYPLEYLRRYFGSPLLARAQRISILENLVGGDFVFLYCLLNDYSSEQQREIIRSIPFGASNAQTTTFFHWLHKESESTQLLLLFIDALPFDQLATLCGARDEVGRMPQTYTDEKRHAIVQEAVTRRVEKEFAQAKVCGFRFPHVPAFIFFHAFIPEGKPCELFCRLLRDSRDPDCQRMYKYYNAILSVWNDLLASDQNVSGLSSQSLRERALTVSLELVHTCS
jgi:hypothetical protein